MPDSDEKAMSQSKDEQSSEQASSFLHEGGANKDDDVDSLWIDDEPAEPGDNYVTIKKRIYYADWVRAIAIQLVIFVHCLVNSADAAGFDPEENVSMQQKKDGIVKSLVQIGIPMFFYVAGLASSFYNSEGKGFFLYLWDKFLRLFVPFVAGIFIFLLPRLYLGQEYEDFTRPNGEIETDYWEFIKLTLPTIFSKLSWLWYLPALLIDCIITYPLLAWTIRRARKIPYSWRDDGNIVLSQAVIFLIWLYPCFYMDTDLDFGKRYLLPSTITLIIIFIIFYTFQLLIHLPGCGQFAMWIKLIGPLGGIALNWWKTQQKDMPLHHVLMMINYDAVFFSQGVIDALYFKQMLRTRSTLAKTPLAPFSIVFAILLYSLSSPQNYT